MPPVTGHPRISKDLEILTGLPRITGTRIGVDLIKRNVAAGMTKDMLLKVYPQLTREDIDAALAYGEPFTVPQPTNFRRPQMQTEDY